MPRSDKKKKEEKAVSLKDKNAERPDLGRRKFVFVGWWWWRPMARSDKQKKAEKAEGLIDKVCLCSAQ